MCLSKCPRFFTKVLINVLYEVVRIIRNSVHIPGASKCDYHANMNVGMNDILMREHGGVFKMYMIFG